MSPRNHAGHGREWSRPDRGASPLPPLQGACFGFGVHADTPCAYLRGGDGLPLVLGEHTARGPTTGTPAQRWPAIAGKRLPVRLFTGDGQHTVLIGRTHRFDVARGAAGQAAGPPARITMSRTRSRGAREVLLWTTPAAVAIAMHGALALHAAAVDVDGGSVLIAGDSGAGKTTTAAACMQAGHRLLADDLSACGTQHDPVVLPGPALVRMDPDGARRLLDLTSQPEIPPGAKLAVSIPGAERGSGAPVALRAIVLLGDAPDSNRMRPMAPAESLRRLWPAVFHLPGDDERARTFGLLAALVGRVPAYHAASTRRWTQLPSLVERIVAVAHA